MTSEQVTILKSIVNNGNCLGIRCNKCILEEKGLCHILLGDLDQVSIAEDLLNQVVSSIIESGNDLYQVE